MKKILESIAGLAFAGAVIAAQVDTTHPMVTGKGNVSGGPGAVIVTNQTSANSEQPVVLEKFVLTGSLIKTPSKTPNGR